THGDHHPESSKATVPKLTSLGNILSQLFLSILPLCMLSTISTICPMKSSIDQPLCNFESTFAWDVCVLNFTFYMFHSL
ncbi:hypothetical protein VIGAN_UM014900, partial [Vigna angularis var. angularis]